MNYKMNARKDDKMARFFEVSNDGRHVLRFEINTEEAYEYMEQGAPRYATPSGIEGVKPDPMFDFVCLN